jgi:predicted N-acetyltransferase YhbS
VPYTPYHFGPSGFIGLALRRWLDVPVFVLANVIVDLEVLAIAELGLGWPTHRYFHTLLVGAAVGIGWGVGAYPLRRLFRKAMQVAGLSYQTSLPRMVVSGVLGVWLHVFIDAIYHGDVWIFWPSKSRRVYQLLGRPELLLVCKLSFIGLAALYVIGLVLAHRARTRKGVWGAAAASEQTKKNTISAGHPATQATTTMVARSSNGRGGFLPGGEAVRLRVLKELEIDEALDAAIRQMLVSCFPRDKSVYSHTRVWHGSTPAFTVLIEKAGQVVAHLCLIDRVIRVADQQLRVAGVGNVCVLPDYRGKGLSGRILKAAMKYAGQAGFDWGLLFTSEGVKKVYARNGWRLLPNVIVIRVENGQKIERPPEAVTMVYPLKLAEFPAGVVHLQGNDW